MFSTAKNTPRRDPATVAADFRDQLVGLLDQALADHAKVYALADMLEAQLVRLRMREAARPW